ncbi:MAG: PHP domain-containing protein [Anaerolineae bacterium]|nr:PHP domain-containing protein [Anaerolineae bacterium]
MKVDLHIHTRFSNDSLTTLEDVLRWARRRGLDALAITDHNTIEGALRLAQRSPIPIIIGEEIRTRQGELIGLFLQEPIPPNLSLRETAELIHKQGGIVYVPHPLDRVRHSAVGREALLRIISQVDAIEVLNARVTFPLDNQLARELAQRYDLPQGAGSDAHQGFEIGRAYVEMPPFEDATSFLQSLRRARLGGRLSSPLVHVGSMYAKVAKELIPSMR